MVLKFRIFLANMEAERGKKIELKKQMVYLIKRKFYILFNILSKGYEFNIPPKSIKSWNNWYLFILNMGG